MKIKSIVRPIRHDLGPNDSLSKVAGWLKIEGIAAFPVTDLDGTLLGLITAQDVVAASEDDSNSEEARTIAELVRPSDVCTLAADVVSLAAQARNNSHPHMVVVDNLGNLAGIADLSPYYGCSLCSPSSPSSLEVKHREDALDEALEETFPASDPISSRWTIARW